MNNPTSDIKPSKAEQTRAKIIDAFLNIMAEKKWDKITVKELCGVVSITRGTFYQYFSDIYDLMEQIQTELLDDVTGRYNRIAKKPVAAFPLEQFTEKFDYTAPESLRTWFNFCNDNHKAIAALLDPDMGDEYFCKKIRNKLHDYINDMMDQDGMACDSLRDYFLKVFLELHFLVARTWLTAKDDGFLSADDLIQLLNSMRVGANYLTWKSQTSADFSRKMQFFDK